VNLTNLDKEDNLEEVPERSTRGRRGYGGGEGDDGEYGEEGYYDEGSYGSDYDDYYNNAGEDDEYGDEDRDEWKISRSKRAQACRRGGGGGGGGGEDDYMMSRSRAAPAQAQQVQGLTKNVESDDELFGNIQIPEALQSKKKETLKKIGFQKLEQTAEYTETQYYQQTSSKTKSMYKMNKFFAAYLQHMLSGAKEETPFLTAEFMPFTDYD
jgi:hypothetical protein